MKAKDRPFTMFAARTALGPVAAKRLEEGKCPMCGSDDKNFRDAVSKKEHAITGICQPCQDKVFADPADSHGD